MGGRPNADAKNRGSGATEKEQAWLMPETCAFPLPRAIIFRYLYVRRRRAAHVNSYFGFSARVTPGITFGKPFPSKLSFK